MADASSVRMLVVIVLLVATLAITAAMAIRAQYAAREHREAAENVVRDWTRVAADELARRADAQASYYGTYPILQQINNITPLPSARELQAAAKTPMEKRNAALVLETFRYGGGDNPAFNAILAKPPRPEDQRPIHTGDRTWVYALSSDNRTLTGFVVNRAALGPFFDLAMTVRPLLPRSLANGEVGNDAIRARATDASGRVLWTAGLSPAATRSQYRRAGRPAEAAETAALLVRHRADDDGLLRGVVVEAGIAPAAVPSLVTGGIPRSLPVYVVLLVLTAVLLVTAILQIGRERALARLRSDFVAGVSHELRTPLTQIRMFAETLKLDRIRSDKERRRSLEVIDQESRRLAQLVENVLRFSRGERGMLRISPRDIDVGDVVRDAVKAFLPIATARGTRITTSIDENAMASVDDDAMRQVVLNLLDNAVKYGPDGQEIVVEVRRGRGFVRIGIEDEGPGVPPRQRKRIWERYARLPRERESAIAGAGIGLAVVRDIVLLHRARAWCETGVRGGARFVVEVRA